MNRRRFLFIAGAAVLSGTARAEVTTWQADMLGGTVRVDLRGPRSLAGPAAAMIGATIAEIEQAASLFKADSALCRLNASGRLDEVPDALHDLFTLSDEVYRATDGRFDPTVQPLWRTFAEGRDPEQARALIGWNRVRSGPPARLDDGQALTFNGIAQGYAADRVRQVLHAAGYGQALVEMGEFAALGGPFRLSVEDPAIGAVGTRQLMDSAIATSSPSAMRLGRGFHILGPHGERPNWSTVAVEAQSAALADGFSTAFCLMSAEEIRTALEKTRAVTRVTAVDSDGNVSTF